ncbi:MAG: hypothetical protein M1823_008759, partial [Watsoniomyces obsoletus]
ISSEGGTPPVPDPESDEALVAEIERQFGLYEARQLQDAFALESPEYREDDNVPLLPAPGRRQTVAFAPMRIGSGGAGAAPPEYNADSVGRRGVGSPRTQSVSLTLFA